MSQYTEELVQELQRVKEERDDLLEVLRLASGIFRKNMNEVYPHDPEQWRQCAKAFVGRVYDWYNLMALPKLEGRAVGAHLRSKWADALKDLMLHADTFNFCEHGIDLDYERCYQCDPPEKGWAQNSETGEWIPRG